MCMRMYVRKEMFYGYMGEREMFYLTTHSTHFIYGYMGEREMFYLTTHSTHFIYGYMGEREMFYLTRERDVAQSIACPPSQWTKLQFGLFSVPTRGPQLVYQRPWYVLFCLWKSAYKRSLAAYRKE